ncbi:MAG: DUF6702 family protein [Planctomycetota bacterium]
MKKAILCERAFTSLSTAMWFPVVFVVLVFGRAEAALAWTHPFHISLAEMEFNADTKRFEVSLKMHAADLENAIAQRTGKRIDVEEDGGEEQIIAYLNEHFFLFAFEPDESPESGGPNKEGNAGRDSDAVERAEVAARTTTLKKALGELAKEEREKSKAFSKLHFVGKEMETTWVWVYFEMELPKRDTASDGDSVAPLVKLQSQQWGIQNSILLDMIRGQINTVSLRAANKRVSLKFNAQTYLADFDSDWFAKAELAGKDAD